MSRKHSVTKFQDSWLTQPHFKGWVRKTSNPCEAQCTVCSAAFDISVGGVSALRSHARGKKHVAKTKGGTSILHFVAGKVETANVAAVSSPDSASSNTQSGSGTTPQSKIDDFTLNQRALDAEIRWCLRMVSCHGSYNSCTDLGDTFKTMFPDSHIAQQFTLGKTKSRYTIIYGIAPELKKRLIYDVNRSPFYSVLFDETLNSEMQMCQMDVGIHFWNEVTGMAETRYFDSQFMLRPNADTLLAKLEDSVAMLDKSKFLQLSMDGPNVNWNVLDLLDNKLLSDGFSTTVSIGSCAQHTVHGSLKTGFNSLEFEVRKILKAMFWLFNDSPARRSVYLTEGISDDFPLRFCETRWVDDRPVSDRGIEVWPSVKLCISYWEKLSKSKRPQNKSYEKLVDYYTDPLVPAIFHFFSFVAGMFEPYLVRFQTDAPMLPFMYSELSVIFMRLIRLVFRKQEIDSAGSIQKMLKMEWQNNTKNHLYSTVIDIGAGTKSVLASLSLASEKKRKNFLIANK